MYGDFGDVVDMRFDQWWQRVGRYLFAERKEVPQVKVYDRRSDLEEITNLRDKIVIEVPLTLRKSTVVRQINKALKQAYEGREVVPRQQSTARRRLAKSKLRKETSVKMLDVYELRNRKPDLTLWQLGERAGIELDLHRFLKSNCVCKAAFSKRLLFDTLSAYDWSDLNHLTPPPTVV